MILTDTFQGSSQHPYSTSYDTETGQGQCSCPWGGERMRPRDCKHTKQLAARAASGATTSTPAPTRTPAAPAAAPSAPEAHAERPPDPMLASAMTTGQTIESFTAGAWALEEKYDGHRVLVRKTGDTIEAWSRPGRSGIALRRTLPPHILARLRLMPDFLVDGEVYIPGGKSSDVTRGDLQHKLVLVLFDALEVLGKSLVRNPYHERRSVLATVLEHTFDGTVQLAKQYVLGRGAVEAIWNRGGEGAILKRLDSPYQPGRRSPDWIKVKRGGTTVMQIAGFEAGKFGPYTTALCRGTEVAEAKVLTLDNATRVQIARDPEAFIGRWLVVQYVEKLASGKLRHATWDHLAAASELPAIEVEAKPAPEQPCGAAERNGQCKHCGALSTIARACPCDCHPKATAANQPPALSPAPTTAAANQPPALTAGQKAAATRKRNREAANQPQAQAPAAANQPPASAPVAPVALTAGQKAALTRRRNLAAAASGVPVTPIAVPRAALDLAAYVRGQFARL